MRKATDEMVRTHRVMRKVLESFDLGNARFPEIIRTLRRTLRVHASLHDNLLAPVLQDRSLIQVPFLKESVQEHQDLDSLLRNLVLTPHDMRPDLVAAVEEIRTGLETHFLKEAKVLYPLAERILDLDTLNRLGEEMANYRHAPAEMGQR